MDILDNIKASLDQNKNLTKEVKTDIFELTILFNKKFPNVSLDKLSEKLKTIKIIKSNKFINRAVSKYNFKDNVLEFNILEIEKGYDMKHVLMFELLDVITNNDIQTGFNYDNKLRALQAGYKEILTNNIVGNESDLPYLEDEIVSTNLIAAMIGNDVLFNAYFNNDTKTLLNALMNKGVVI